MTRSRAARTDGRGAPLEDPQAVREVLRLLFEAETEFLLKVEGTATLPYAAWVQSLPLEEGKLVLKLVRPLPHEMPAGAQFRMTFAAEDQRYEGIVALVGREAYLQYGFQLPSSLFLSDRRRHRRFPFRPRESAYVIAQDAGIPGLGLAGPLVNIGLGGMAVRVDRVLRMDDGVRIPVNAGLFDRGKGLPRFRIQDLPRLPLLEGRGMTTHATWLGSELVLGAAFTELLPAEEAALTECLAFREKMFRGGAAARPEGEPRPARAGRARADEAGEEAPAPEETAPEAPDDAPAEVPVLLRLQRRSARVVLVMAEGPVRAGVQETLRRHGYHRQEAVADLARLAPLCDPFQRRARPALVLADLALARSGDAEPLAAVRIIESRMAELGNPRTVVLCEEVDPTLSLVQGPRTRFLPYPEGDGSRWVETLDGMLGG